MLYKVRTNQRGAIGATEIILIVFVLAILGFVGWRVYDANQSTDESKANTEAALHSQVPADDATRDAVGDAIEENSAAADEDADANTSDEDGESDAAAPKTTKVNTSEYSLILPEGWKKDGAGDLFSGDKYTNGTFFMEIEYAPGGHGFYADTTWTTTHNSGTNAFTVTKKSNKICKDPNDSFCDYKGAAKDSLIIVSPAGEVKGNTWTFYFGNTASGDLSKAPLADFEAIIESVKVK